MTARYQLLKVGVYDNDAQRAVLPADGALWDEYIAWVRDNLPDPYVPPPEAPPTAEETAARAERDTRTALRTQLKALTVIQQLRTRTPAEVDAWINTNVTDLASAKVVLRILAYVVAYLAREKF